LDVFAYCTLPARPAVAHAMGVVPFTSPPYTAKNFSPRLMVGNDFLYFRLHQIESMPGIWLGEDLNGDMSPALRLDQIANVNLSGAVVLIANCYSSDSPFIPAFYACGAGAVIAAPGKNYAAGDQVIGADLLAQWIRRLIGRGWPVGRALAAARGILTMTSWRAPDRDALAFQIMQNPARRDIQEMIA
jgi:hypothetical protein